MKLNLAILVMMFLFKNGDNFIPSCSYIILNLPYNTTVGASAEVEEPIYSIVVEDLAGYSAPNITDLKTPSEYFMIQNNDVSVKSCLPVSDNSSVIFDLEILIIGEETICPSSYLTVTVQFAVPEFNMRSRVDVDLYSCSPSDVLEVQQVQFKNDDRCNITFNCFVNSTNSDKLFLYGPGGAITTTAADIDFNWIYKLNITCYDSRTSPSSAEAASETLDVKFNNSHSCILSTTSTDYVKLTLSSSTVTATTGSMSTGKYKEKTDTGFLDSPANVAILSSVGGVAAAASLGAAGTLAYSKKCRSENADITA